MVETLWINQLKPSKNGDVPSFFFFFSYVYLWMMGCLPSTNFGGFLPSRTRSPFGFRHGKTIQGAEELPRYSGWAVLNREKDGKRMGKGWKRRFQSLKSHEIWGYVRFQSLKSDEIWWNDELCYWLLTLVVTRKWSILMHGMMACAS